MARGRLPQASDGALGGLGGGRLYLIPCGKPAEKHAVHVRLRVGWIHVQGKVGSIRQKDLDQRREHGVDASADDGHGEASKDSECSLITA